MQQRLDNKLQKIQTNQGIKLQQMEDNISKLADSKLETKVSRILQEVWSIMLLFE